ncbi:MAG: VOC family protein [Desulfovibrionaceae bacterium]|nr:VOC family protein [Desulfovibrionaceae bacterium]
MRPTGISPTIVVRDVTQAKEFYAAHFDARVVFDCGWYVGLMFGQDGPTIHLMQPQSPDQPEYKDGLTYNVRYADTGQVDAMHDRLSGAGLPIVMPLEDHPWGDRGFATLDPYGVAPYVYADIEPSEEFRQYFT